MSEKKLQVISVGDGVFLGELLSEGTILAGVPITEIGGGSDIAQEINKSQFGFYLSEIKLGRGQLIKLGPNSEPITRDLTDLEEHTFENVKFIMERAVKMAVRELEVKTFHGLLGKM